MLPNIEPSQKPPPSGAEQSYASRTHFLLAEQIAQLRAERAEILLTASACQRELTFALACVCAALAAVMLTAGAVVWFAAPPVEVRKPEVRKTLGFEPTPAPAKPE